MHNVVYIYYLINEYDTLNSDTHYSLEKRYYQILAIE